MTDKTSKTLLFFLLLFVSLLPWPAHASGKTLVLLPLTIYADQPEPYLRQGFKSMFVARLSGGGLEVIDDERLEPLLTEKEKKGITSKARAEELARALKADYAVFGSITTIGGGYSLDLSLLELKGSKLKRVSAAVDENMFIPKLADVAYRFRAIIEGKQITAREMPGRAEALPEPETARGLFSKLGRDEEVSTPIEKGLFFRPARGYQGFKPTGKIPVKMTVMAFDMGDLDGRGSAELLVLDRKKLLIYQRQGESFALKGTIKPSLGEDFLKVSVGDVDNNGKAEIYLVSRYGIRARTCVWEWTGTFKKLDRRIGHMQVIRDPAGGNPMLVFQNSKVDEFFSGRIYIMDYEKPGKPTKKEPLPKLKGARFYSLARFDLNEDGEPEWLGLGDESRLYVWDKQGDVIWNGDKHLGGTNNAIRLGDAPSGDPLPRISFESRLLITDIDGDGKKEVLAIKNIPIVEHLLGFKVYTKSQLMAYSIEGTELFPAWATGDIGYCLTGMQADGQAIYLAAQKGRITNVGKGSGCIMWFE